MFEDFFKVLLGHYIKGTHAPLLIPVAIIGKCKQANVAPPWSCDSLIIYKLESDQSAIQGVLPQRK